MIRYTTKLMLAVSLFVLGGFTAANAQMDSDTILKVKIPNPFVLRDKTYPAGDYTIKPTDDLTDSAYVLQLQGPGRATAFFDTFGTTANMAPENTEIVFQKVGDKYFLSKIWVKGETNGNEIEKCKMEKKLAAAGQPSELYTVNADRMTSKEKKTH